MILGFVILYLLVSVGIGLAAARRVHTAKDFAVAGRSLPLPIVTATVFATWFGAEAVVGMPAIFVKDGLRGVVADPFGASLCLILAGLFFAPRLYRLNLLTVGDYYRLRYNQTVEVLCTLCVVASYLGWVAAQFKVLGLVFNWGALVGWAAIKGSIGWPSIVLFAGCVLWTVGYDTIYAHQDKEEDALLGLGSTAINFGDDTTSVIGALYGCAVLLWLLAGTLAGMHLIYYLALTLVFLQMSWQVSTLDTNDPANCLRRFRSNRDIGIAVFLGLVADMTLSWFAGLA